MRAHEGWRLPKIFAAPSASFSAASICPCWRNAEERSIRASPFDAGGRTPFIILEELQDCPQYIHGFVGTEGVERTASHEQPVLDSLLGKIAFGAVMDELRIDAIETSGVALFEQLGVTAVKRFPLSSGQSVVEDVADDSARKSEPVSARFPLLFNQSFVDQAVDDVVQLALAFGERFQFAEFEAPSDD